MFITKNLVSCCLFEGVSEPLSCRYTLAVTMLLDVSFYFGESTEKQENSKHGVVYPLHATCNFVASRILFLQLSLRGGVRARKWEPRITIIL